MLVKRVSQQNEIRFCPVKKKALTRFIAPLLFNLTYWVIHLEKIRHCLSKALVLTMWNVKFCKINLIIHINTIISNIAAAKLEFGKKLDN